jgi:hypothetical protein
MSAHTTKRRRLHRGIAVLLGLVVLGCGPQFDPPSKLQSLRILAVKKDPPYVKPTEPNNVAHMTLAMHDPRPDADKQDPSKRLQKLWFAGCNNPPRDNYFSCLLTVWLSFKALSELGPGPAGLQDGQSWSVLDVKDQFGNPDYARLYEFVKDTFPEATQQTTGTDVPGPNDQSLNEDLINAAMAIRVGAGDTFDYTVDTWVFGKHEPSSDPSLPRYGLSMVFLAVCDGQIGFAPGWEKDVDPLATLTDSTRGFPLTCYRTGTKNERGSDNFMVSYSNLYVYEELTNQNPVVTGFKFDGKDVDASAVCIGEACVGAQEPSCDSELTPKVKLCLANDRNGCKEYEITPSLTESENSEFDEIASRTSGAGAQLREQMWIRYYADQGEVSTDAKRLQDATEGWFPEHAAKWAVPKAGEGIAHIWSVVYDNRGGVDWARISVCLES